MATPHLITTEPQLRHEVARARAEGDLVGLVPTMGALHEGHLSLVRAARQQCGFVVVSIFVNPTQFGPHEDFAVYPRQLQADCAMLRGLADAVFAPSTDVVYPLGFSTYVDPPDVARRWEGEFRPGHFRGVATIVLKLFTLVQPDVAYFGEKDYQQLQVIRRMVADLNVPVEIMGCELVREPDGLAMSSRNRRLSPEQRSRALSVSAALFAARDAVGGGIREAERLQQLMLETLQRAPVDKIDYVAIVDPDTLEPVPCIEQPAQALIAAHVGSVRLIDNIRLSPEPS